MLRSKGAPSLHELTRYRLTYMRASKESRTTPCLAKNHVYSGKQALL